MKSNMNRWSCGERCSTQFFCGSFYSCSEELFWMQQFWYIRLNVWTWSIIRHTENSRPLFTGDINVLQRSVWCSFTEKSIYHSLQEQSEKLSVSLFTQKPFRSSDDNLFQGQNSSQKFQWKWNRVETMKCVFCLCRCSPVMTRARLNLNKQVKVDDNSGWTPSSVIFYSLINSDLSSEEDVCSHYLFVIIMFSRQQPH